jgi:hypothetical protein
VSLRDLAAMHRSRILAAPQGLAEDIVHIDDATGIRTAGRGTWLEMPSDNRNPTGIGAEATLGRAQVVISADWMPALTRADRIERVATGEAWGVEQIIPTPGVGRKLILSQDGEALGRGAR